MRNIFLIILTIILILPSVSAENQIPISYWFKQFQDVQLKIPCQTASGSLCSASASCNASTLIDSNHTIFINTVTLTNQGFYHNYSFNTSLTGQFTHTVTCRDGNNNGTSLFRTETNPTGVPPTQERTDTLSRSIWIFFLISLFFLISGTVTNTKFIIKITLLIFGAIFLLITINNVGVTLRDEIVNPQLVSLFDIITAISFYVYMALGFAVFIMWMFSVILSIGDFQRRKKEEKYSYD